MLSHTRSILIYALILAAAVAIFFLIRGYGESLPIADKAPAPAARSAPSSGQFDAIYHVLLALVVIVIACRLVGALFYHLHQPRVIGEVVAGILLGPSLLGQISPEAMHYILPDQVGPHLKVIAQLGVILYMFLVGLELNGELLRSRAHATVAISHTSIVVPFVLGAALALWLFCDYAPVRVSFTSFALFMGVAMAITAFPVLARILTDRRMDKTELGVMALSCAAVDDVTAWCLLALVVGIAQAEVEGAAITIALAIAYIAVMFLAIGPLARRYLGGLSEAHLKRGVLAWLLVALMVSAWLTEAIGVHAIFGAFVLGAVIPHDSAVARVFTHKLEDIVSVLLLPAFFALTGMRTQIGLLTGLHEWLVCLAIVLVAVAGKFGGTLVAARCTGLNWNTSAALGVLMNTRGLMELIVLNIGLELGVISDSLFAMMVLMALATTLMTSPLLHVLSAGSFGATEEGEKLT